MAKGKSKKVKGKTKTVIRFTLSLFAPSFCFCLFTFSFLLLLSPPSALAQDDDLAPPPLKLITKEERTRLEAAPDVKARTKLAVEMMKLRIDSAEKLNNTGDFDGIFRELGHFRGLLDYSLAFLQQQDAKQNRTLDNYKRLEISLRAAAPRIESIRRELPARYEEYVRQLLIYIRDARTKAIEPLFSDTVIPDKVKNEK